MLCIAVAPESRRLGKVDLYNAAAQADLVEFRLDRLEKDPDIKEMIDGINKPILISCRRTCDGGGWDGSEDERMALLREAIIAEPAYIELDLDIANKIPRFGKTKRVISYTTLDKPLSNLEPILERAIAAKADVVKLTGPMPTLDAAWPTLATVTKKRNVPVVGMGLGPGGVTMSVLGLKYGAPWVYAALEKGMEAYEGQNTVSEFEDIYRWREITPQTRFIGVCGHSDTDKLRVRVMNAAFAHHQLPIRCLPLELGVTDKLTQMLDALHISVLVGNNRMAERLLNLASDMEEAARVAQYTDLVVKQKDGWQAFNTMWRSALKAIENKLGAKTPEDRPLDRRNVFIIGTGGAAKGVAFGIQKRKGMISITSGDDNDARMAATMFGARFVPMANMYDTLCDVVVITEAYAMERGGGTSGGKQGIMLNPSFLRPHMLVTDFSNLPLETELLEEARLRGCKVLDPADLFLEHTATLFKTICGRELPLDVAREAAGLGPE